jgi:hypothetical protein
MKLFHKQSENSILDRDFYSEYRSESRNPNEYGFIRILIRNLALLAFILTFSKKKHVRCAGRGRQQADQWEGGGKRQSHSGIGVLFLLSGGGPLGWIR